MTSKYNFNLISLLLTLGLASKVLAYSNYYSIRTNSIDDGTKSVTQYESQRLDSVLHKEPEVDRRLFIGPSKFGNSLSLTDSQIFSNNIGQQTSLSSKLELGRPFFQHKIDGKRRNRGFLTTRARTVESPALSVDSGGRASGGGVASEIAKLLNVKQGHHANFYDQIDWPAHKSPASTKRPADAIEDGVRSAVLRMFNEQQSRL